MCIIGFRWVRLVWNRMSTLHHLTSPCRRALPPLLTKKAANHANPPVHLLPPSLSLSHSHSPLSLAYLSLPSLTGMNCHTTAMDDPMIAIHTTLTALGTLTK